MEKYIHMNTQVYIFSHTLTMTEIFMESRKQESYLKLLLLLFCVSVCVSNPVARAGINLKSFHISKFLIN